ncbi:hypothetical protein FIV42_22050 [Persicimonas caeni]|uniref:MYXO-CTERM domain-containing protein n=1 Tax=Persicimonas caeni TaxID=2292766 RepID=A0A4Y6PYU1_PERCE|nr:MYXO-CTERM sorting domain-containing protein [Persicimonas caeni]QDG53329.1 hypothetical protein FIV42_22050 [Persicimonas caeni]QED34550.1 hypothetical protein FRD00_22045 [Persicimonas caeni]
MTFRAIDRFITASLLAAIGVGGLPADAEACTPAPCTPAEFPYDQKMVPPGVVGLPWYPGSNPSYDGDIEASDVSLYELESGDSIPFELLEHPNAQAGSGTNAHSFYFIRPTVSLSPGTAYRVEALDLCTLDENGMPVAGLSEATFATACESAPLPTELGALRSGPNFKGPLPVQEQDGCNSLKETSQVRLWLEPSEEARPWMGVLEFELASTDDTWPTEPAIGERLLLGESRFGRGREVLVTWCDPDSGQPIDPGVPPGTHQVYLKASIPGTDVALETAPVEVTLACDAPLEDEVDADWPLPVYDGRPDSGCDVSLEEPPHVDADVGPDVGEDVGSDVGEDVGQDVGDDVGQDVASNAQRPSTPDEGCGCSQSSPRPTGGLALVVLVLVGMWGRRRGVVE